MIDERFVYLTLVVNLIGTVHYVVETLAGRVRPNRASWLMWAVAPAVVLAAELQQGVGLRAVMTFGIVLGPVVVLLASYATTAAYWRLGRFDWACGALSALAVLLWVVTESAAVAIILSIAADFLAAVPTVRKAITHPDTEHPFFYALVSMGGAVTLLTIQRWSFADWAFPVYIFVFPGVLALLIWRQRARQALRPLPGGDGLH